ncbi:hypothetical protein OGAPHI_003210 [Ogataea philodendri]|uniref:L-type lectin-like domain-containing protein n=1 Tax=Ogataea philodendri TaxID=1378263 RepID=A0A9P8P7Y7_9ASCO|nr:uncharacterized protein OGAPHI_003210 [Ogataea philodendri]KAH3666761.1 hypothetical protein OGAPHI_003210 [Ogataea philodendri]
MYQKYRNYNNNFPVASLMDIGVRFGESRPQKVRRFLASTGPKTRLVAFIVFVFFALRYFAGSKPVVVSESEPNDVQDLIDENEIRREKIQYLNFAQPFLNPATLSLVNYENGGNMVMKKDAEYVRLVPEQPNSVGYVFSRLPISLKEAGAFEAVVDFRIHGEQNRMSLIGDGMAFWLTSEPLSQGNLFGMQSNYHGLTVILDTFKNTQNRLRKSNGATSFPRVSIQTNNGVHDKYNKDDDGTSTEIGSCSLHRVYNTRTDTPSRMRLMYVRSSNLFQVDFDVLGDGSWKTCFTTKELSSSLIPQTPYFGVSAETGELSHNVDLYGIEVSALKDTQGNSVRSVDALMDKLDDKIDAENKQSEAKRRHRRLERKPKPVRRKSSRRLKQSENRAKRRNMELHNDERGAIGSFFSLVWAVIKYTVYTAMALVLAYIGLLAYRVYREKRRKPQRGLL